MGLYEHVCKYYYCHYYVGSIRIQGTGASRHDRVFGNGLKDLGKAFRLRITANKNNELRRLVEI